MISITCLSDLHGHYPQLEGGDILIVAGDLTARDTPLQHLDFIEWVRNQPYKKKIVIAGNHDGFIEQLKSPYFHHIQTFVYEIEYLCDSGTEFEGLKIWGSPWSSQFPGINPKCCAFTRPYGVSLKDKWDLIPDDVDILITHTSPYGILDQVEGKGSVGDLDLLEAVTNRIRSRLHVYGHIHQGYGQVTKNSTIFVNASFVDERYRPVNKPVRIQL